MALATCEAEINSIKDGSCDAVYFKELLSEINNPGHSQPVTMIGIEHIPTTEMIADALIKAFPEQQHRLLMTSAGMTGF